LFAVLVLRDQLIPLAADARDLKPRVASWGLRRKREEVAVARNLRTGGCPRIGEKGADRIVNEILGRLRNRNSLPENSFHLPRKLARVEIGGRKKTTIHMGFFRDAQKIERIMRFNGLYIG
jgi:hypothetical protein